MDTLYIGDIPSDYHYAVFSNGYITLYDRASATNQTLNYYRIYTTNNGFYYSTGTTNFSYTTQYFTDIKVSNDWHYRTDVDKIYCVAFISILCICWLINLVSETVKKGGAFGGLL